MIFIIFNLNILWNAYCMQERLQELEQKYKDAMVSNAQLYNEKTTLFHQVDALKDKYVCTHMCIHFTKHTVF